MNSFMTQSLSYRNQPIDLQSKSIDWFLWDRDLNHERVHWEKFWENAVLSLDNSPREVICQNLLKLFCENIFPKKLHHRSMAGSYIDLCYLKQPYHDDEAFIWFIYVRHLNVFGVFNSGCIFCLKYFELVIRLWKFNNCFKLKMNSSISTLLI